MAAAASLILLTPRAGQAQQEVRICYIPNTGLVYVIGDQIGRDACVEDSHFEIAPLAPEGAEGWTLLGNGGLPQRAFLGTLDESPLEFRVNNLRVMRFQPGPAEGGPSIVGGSQANSIDTGLFGATIAGGGRPDEPNSISGEGEWSAIGGGLANTASGRFSTIAGGAGNTAGGAASSVLGGEVNSALGPGSVVGGGTQNAAEGLFSTVAGGGNNLAPGNSSMVPGGFGNEANGDFSFAAGRQAIAAHDGSFVWADDTPQAFSSTAQRQFLIRAGGGVGIGTAEPQSALDVLGTVRATGLQLTTAPTAGYVLTSDVDGVATWQPGGTESAGWALTGNSGTSASGFFLGTTDSDPLELRVNSARVGVFEDTGPSSGPNVNLGFRDNSVASMAVGGTIGGGGNSAFPNALTSNGGYGTVSGGQGNSVDAFAGSVGGGGGNAVSSGGQYATVSGGNGNRSGAFAATVPGGQENAAIAQYSLAAGRRATARHPGTFVWGDATEAPVVSTGENQFVVQASGGVTLYNSGNSTDAVVLAPGSGSWSTLSDRGSKRDFRPVDAESILSSVALLPVQSWQYKAQRSGIRHVGPTAQDFSQAFGLGESDTAISSVDLDGVNMLAIQALERRTVRLAQENDELRARLAELESLLGRLSEGSR